MHLQREGHVADIQVHVFHRGIAILFVSFDPVELVREALTVFGSSSL